MVTEFSKIFLGRQSCQVVQIQSISETDSVSIIVEYMELVSEMRVFHSHLMQLLA